MCVCACDWCQDALNAVVIKDMRSNKDNIVDAVLAVDLLYKESRWSDFSIELFVF